MFKREFLLALADWQNGWNENQDLRRRLAQELLEQSASLPQEFRQCDQECYRKRFFQSEITALFIEGEFAEGIASWSTNQETTKKFKEMVRLDGSFGAIFRQVPLEKDVVLNISRLWQNEEFQAAVHAFNKEDPERSKALLNFRDRQSEVVLRSTLKLAELNDIIGKSHDFDTICHNAGIPEEKQEEVSRQLASAPINMPLFAGPEATKRAIVRVIEDFRQKVLNAHSVTNAQYTPHPVDVRHSKNFPDE